MNENSVDNSVRMNFKMYTNPANSYLQIDLLFNPAKETKIHIIHSTVRLIKNMVLDTSVKTFNISELSDGI